MLKRGAWLFSCFILVLCLASGSLAGPVLESIKASGQIRVGLDPTFPPLEAKAKDGSLMGFDVDLALHIAQAMGVRLLFSELPFRDLLPALKAKQIDLVISGMTITPLRNLEAVFVGPYLLSGQTALIRSQLASRVRRVADLNSSAYAVATASHTTSEQAVKDILPKARLLTVRGEQNALRLLLGGQAHAMVADMPFCAAMAFRYAEQDLVHLDVPFTFEPLGMAIAPGDPELANWLNNFLTVLKGRGRLDNMGDYWFRDPSWLKRLP